MRHRRHPFGFTVGFSRIAGVSCAVALAALLLLGVGAKTGGSQSFTITLGASANGDTDWQYMEGLYSCIAYGSNWDSATIDMESRIASTSDVKDVGVAALVGMTADIVWTAIDAGSGEYRFEVTGGGASMDIVLHCRRIRT